jgi:tRNA-dihydrouridine synthase A
VHFRQLARYISQHTWLWTEMVVDKTIVHSDRLDSHLWFPAEQRPLVLQMGGSDPATIRQAAVKAAAYGYDEINLNCGCPSDRVAGAGCFGATLMLELEVVARCMRVRPHHDAMPAPVVHQRLCSRRAWRCHSDAQHSQRAHARS